MKKQILILVLAVFTAVTVFGQALPGSLPKPLTCIGTALTPFAGRPYDYKATFAPDGGAAFWYATKSTNIGGTGALRLAAVEVAGAVGSAVSTGVNYATIQSPTVSPSTSTITWNSAGLSTVTPAAPLLVVVEYTAPPTGCADNLKVYNIIPKNGFTVDIRSMENDGTGPAAYDINTDQCADIIRGATYNTTTLSMNMNYGVQTLYFEVIAANFTGAFTPSFQISGLTVGQTAEIFWGGTALTATTSLGAIVNGTTVPCTLVTTTATNTMDGVSIYVKVVIQNNKVENLTGELITLAVDAVNAEFQPDVLETDCTVNAAFADDASQDIKLRPTVLPVAPSTFVPQN